MGQAKIRKNEIAALKATGAKSKFLKDAGEFWFNNPEMMPKETFFNWTHAFINESTTKGEVEINFEHGGMMLSVVTDEKQFDAARVASKILTVTFKKVRNSVEFVPLTGEKYRLVECSVSI